MADFSYPHKNSNGYVYVDASDAVSGLYKFANFTRARAKKVAIETAEELQQTMKEKAPWQDRTGDARRYLSAEYFEETTGTTDLNVGVKLSHGVPYGVFLEYNGLYTPSYISRRRPILVPTLNSEKAKELMRRLKNEFSKVAKM